MNKLADMSTFVAVVEAGSLTEAARRVGTTKSVISQRIRQLEARLGTGLVDGLGVSEMPEFMCKAALQQKHLVEVLPEWQFARAKLAVAFPSNRHLSPLVRTFKDFCAKYFESNLLA